ncbi:MAG: tetratricopeptide repeat protein [Acidobacteriota bacterium]|nr:tetratricopeptide repeat protein [Acidobacteriota bacterium]
MEGRHSSPESKRTRSHRLLGVRPLAAIFLGLACIAPLAYAQTTGVISGRVTNSQGQVQTVLVHLLAEGDIPAGDAYSDSNGSYVFTGLPSGTYSVVVEAEGYKPFRGRVQLEGNIEPRGQVMVVLEPATKQAVSKGPAILENKHPSEPYIKHPLPSFDRKAVKEYDKGAGAQQSGNAKAALAHYQKALRIDPDFYPALNNIGTIYERQGNHTLAQEAFLHAMKINPDDGESYINLGHVLYEVGDYRPAIDRLNEGLKRSPESAAGNFFLGSSYYKLRESSKAEPLLKKACALDPFHMAPARLQLANLYLQRHDYESAKLQLQIYLQLSPHAPQAAAAKKILDDIGK